MKKITMCVLAAGVLLAGCGPSEPKQSNPRKAYEEAYTRGKAIHDTLYGDKDPAALDQGAAGAQAMVGILRSCNETEGKEGDPRAVQEAAREGCKDGHLGLPNAAGKYGETP
ncbi:hypothetical protein [Streptomyces virginiae]|uniref:hypothetical protein n=1 Tax=Streptomyces virginiae TaxID=1961 RepID=UPI002F906CAF|nr:hypothetical protein OG253_41960 [Streptomyces virginiae]